MRKIILSLLIVIPIISFAQEKVIWDYPVKPGSEEWRYSTYVEKVKKNQPPFWLMNELKTPELYGLCIGYPFNMDLFLFNNPNIGIRKILSESSCWQEFINRKDALKVLSSKYNEALINEIMNINDKNERTQKIINIYIIEKIISESDIIKKSDLKDQKLLIKYLINKHDEKKKFPDEYFGYTYSSTLSAMLKVLESQNKINAKISENNDFYNLEKRGINNSEELEQEILTVAESILEL
ncbi:hypothetical protein [uncultured Draconibacterium sp.]|uniref:hypothetical protein n=1 Tax=uncultured Draconibacterium sp. TaxID=1573823 RepID=UPI0029C7D851|nr:hypothetical protein [uncultured Draconibacterium sp.]